MLLVEAECIFSRPVVALPGEKSHPRGRKKWKEIGKGPFTFPACRLALVCASAKRGDTYPEGTAPILPERSIADRTLPVRCGRSSAPGFEWSIPSHLSLAAPKFVCPKDLSFQECDVAPRVVLGPERCSPYRSSRFRVDWLSFESSSETVSQ